MTLARFLMSILMMGCLFVSQGFSQTDQDQQIELLISQLSNDSYATRNAAFKKLSALGVTAVAKLAESVLSSDTETRAGCLRILDSMSNANDNTDTMKAALIMRKLADHGYPQLSDNVEEIANAWKVAKVKQNLAKLEQAGAKIHKGTPADILGGGFVVLDSSSFHEGMFGSPSAEQDIKRADFPDEIDQNQILQSINRIANQNDESVQEEFEKEIATVSTAANNRRTGSGGIVFERAGRPAVEVLIRGDGPSVFDPTSSLVGSVELGENWKGTDEDYEVIQMIPSIPVIQLVGIEIDKEMLEKLAKISGLGQISIAKCKFELRELIEFRQTYPQISLFTTNRAFLGITGDVQGATGKGCTISSVVDGSAADKSELKVDDLIVEISGIRVSSFEDLRLMISTLEPESVAKLKIERAGETLEIDVTLGTPPTNDFAVPID